MLILLANTDGPPRRLNAIRMSTFNPWRGRAGAGAARVRDCEFIMRVMYESEGWDKSLFSRITTKNKLRMKIINVPVILADESLFDIVVIIGKARNCTPEQSTPCNSAL